MDYEHIKRNRQDILLIKELAEFILTEKIKQKRRDKIDLKYKPTYKDEDFKALVLQITQLFNQHDFGVRDSFIHTQALTLLHNELENQPAMLDVDLIEKYIQLHNHLEYQIADPRLIALKSLCYKLMEQHFDFIINRDCKDKAFDYYLLKLKLTLESFNQTIYRTINYEELVNNLNMFGVTIAECQKVIYQVIYESIVEYGFYRNSKLDLPACRLPAVKDFNIGYQLNKTVPEIASDETITISLQPLIIEFNALTHYDLSIQLEYAEYILECFDLADKQLYNDYLVISNLIANVRTTLERNEEKETIIIKYLPFN